MRSSIAGRFALAAFAALTFNAVAPSPVLADEATNLARSHYETGLELFYARENGQALIEFQRAHEVKARPATLFMMGQCEYLLGSLRQARDHYEAYLQQSPTGEFVEVAKDRIEAINRRPATLVINTVPDQVDVRITPLPAPPPPRGAFRARGENSSRSLADAVSAGAAPAAVSGQAPNNFAITRGRWTILVSKTNYLSQKIAVEVEVAETKPLFFKLEPIPARLEIETVPANANLYVNGNRARNPYRQDVPPGRYEIFGEAVNYEDHTEVFPLGPGDKHLLVGLNAFHLRYVQRSGRPELVFASALMGGLVGAGAVAGSVTQAWENNPTDVSLVSLTLGGALAGTVGGALIANRFVPTYIPDNRALFIIGGMWVGAAEGALTGLVISQARASRQVSPDWPDLGPLLRRPVLSSQLNAAFLGSLPAILVGTTAGVLIARRAPTYGRVALIQSAAVGGALFGGLTSVAFGWNVHAWQTVVREPQRDPASGRVLTDATGAPKWVENSQHIVPAGASILDLSLPVLIGLNAGLVGGLLGAYLSDQSRYGPSWQRIALIDLATGAGALAAGIGACVADSNCLSRPPGAPERAHAAAFALAGAGAGLVAGIALTRNVDRDSLPASSTVTSPPSLTLLPMPNGHGGVTPMLSAIGFF